ncbi:MAG: VOC family protein [Bacteroidota bacterium]
MAAPVTHFEINVRDGKRAQDFYAGLFGWKIQNVAEMNYGLVDTGVKMGINGGIGQVQEGQNPGVTVYVQVEQLQEYLDKAIALGGRMLTPVTEVPNMVTFALFADPEGNTVGLVKGPQSPPKPRKAKKAPARRKAAARPRARAKTRRGKKR